MTQSKRRKGPSDPQAIAAARVAERARWEAEQRGIMAAGERQTRRDPTAWGVSAQIHYLDTSHDVETVEGHRGQIIAARRSDPFDLLLAAGGLTDDQHKAARRLFRDWCLRAGVRDQDRLVLERIDGGRHDPSAMVTDAMVDAGVRIAHDLKGVGPVSAKLLKELISPMVDEGRIIAWRGVVQRVTGETERHVQGGVVRQACENLRLVHEEWDELARRRREQLEAAAKTRPANDPSSQVA